MPMTPLSGQHYLKPKEPMQVTPVSTATYLVSRLNALIGQGRGRGNADQPSDKLRSLLADCGGTEAADAVVSRIEALGETFIRNYVAGPGTRIIIIICPGVVDEKQISKMEQVAKIA